MSAFLNLKKGEYFVNTSDCRFKNSLVLPGSLFMSPSKALGDLMSFGFVVMKKMFRI